MILLAMVLATTEAQTAKDAWRAPQDHTKMYLRWLSEECSYPLSSIEEVIRQAQGRRRVPTGLQRGLGATGPREFCPGLSAVRKEKNANKKVITAKIGLVRISAT